MTDRNPIRLGTRGSALARWQTDYVRDLLAAVWPERGFEIVVISTRGDEVIDVPLSQMPSKGVFTAEIEDALYSKRIDIAVHSLKDLPVESPQGLVIGAMPPRANPADVLVSRSGLTLRDLPAGASVGTSSLRRAAQLRHLRPDLKIVDIRGNVDTRVRKAHDPDGPYDAIVLAQAGVERLGRMDAITEAIPLEDMLPAPGQGAIAVQCRDEQSTLGLLQPINHADTVAAVEAERAFLAGLGGGCALPIAAYAEVAADRLHLRGRVIAIDGVRLIESEGIGAPDTAYSLGKELAERVLAQGAAEILESIG